MNFHAGIKEIIMAADLLIPVAAYFFIKRYGKLTTAAICWLMLLTGIMLRLNYAIYTGVGVRQHDVHDFFEHHEGHAEYICYIFENRRLPDFDPREKWQFYHPPLHHIVCAIVLTIVDKLGGDVTTIGVKLLQFLSAVYSSLYIIIAYKSLCLLPLKKRTLCVCTAAVAFHPTLILLAGSLNNDMLSSLFGMCAIYFTIKWSEKQRFRDILLIAVSVGAGMMTKLSVGLLAPAIAAVFLSVFIKNIAQQIRSRKSSCEKRGLNPVFRLIIQFVLFGLVCVPIGLYWPVRNYVRFGVPLNYIPRLSENSSQYISQSVPERFFNWLPYQFASPFTQWADAGAPYNEFNPIIALWKNSMFDEGTFFEGCITLQSVCTALFILNIVLSFAVLRSLLSSVRIFKDKKWFLEKKLLIYGIFAVVMGNYFVFCIKYPHVCTQNMRYCVPLIFTRSVMLGMLADDERSEKASAFVENAVALFAFCSAMVYTAFMYFQ